MSLISQAEQDSAAQALIERYGEAGRLLLLQNVPLGLADQIRQREQWFSAAAADATQDYAGDSSTLALAVNQTSTEIRPPFAVQVLNHLTFGATVTSAAEFNALGTTDGGRLTAFVNRQLAPAQINDSVVDAMLTSTNGFGTLATPLTTLWKVYIDDFNTGRTVDPEFSAGHRRPARETQFAALMRAVHSKRQLFEKVVAFWHDHFSVFYDDSYGRSVFPHYTGVIRAHALGNFRAMLEEVAKSATMMYSLDNFSSRGDGTNVPNENFARELIELHTMGADSYLGNLNPLAVSLQSDPDDPAYPAGYVDLDIYETASALTGWSVKGGAWAVPGAPAGEIADGTFLYRAAWHDNKAKFVLGKMLPANQPAIKDGQDVLDRVAHHPRTARYICRKLIRYFISDDLTGLDALISSAAKIFRDNWRDSNQIKLTLQHILTSQALQASWGNKVRRPFELTAAALRVAGSTWAPKFVYIPLYNPPPDRPISHNLITQISQTGHGNFEWLTPDGYPDVASAWLGTHAKAATWRLLQGLVELKESDANGGQHLLPIDRVTRVEFSGPYTANWIVTYWCWRVLGYQPRQELKNILIKFLAQNGHPDLYVIPDTNVASATDLKNHFNQMRIRAMVSLIMMSPEFQRR